MINSVVDDKSELALHITQKAVQLWAQNFFLSTLLAHQPYLPMDALIGSMKKAYSAVVSIQKLLELLELAATSGAAITNLVITRDGVQLRPYSKLSKANLPPIPAVKCRPTDNNGIFLPHRETIAGGVRVSRRG